MNYLEEQMDGEVMINSIKNGDQSLPHVTQVSIAGTSSTEQPPLKDKSIWSDQEKKIQKIDRLARSLLIQGLPNDIYSLIDSNKTIKIYRMLLQGKCLVMNMNLMDINIDALYNILKQNQGDVNDAIGLKKKTVVVTYDPLALIAKKIKVRKRKEKVVVSSDSKGSDEDDFSELKKITALLAKAFNRKKFYFKPTNNLRTSLAFNSANKKQEFVKFDDKKEDKKVEEKKRDMNKVKCYNCKKEEDHAWIETSSDSDKEINSNMVFMAQMEKVLSDSEKSSSSSDETIVKHRKQIADQEILFDKMSYQLVEMNKDVLKLKDNKEMKISELEECVRNKDLEIEKYLERLNDCENKLHKIRQTNQTIHMIMPSKDKLYNGRKGIGFENPNYFRKAKDLRPTLYNERQTSSLKPYVSTVILEKIIIDLEDKVVSLLAKEKENLETNESFKLKGFESSENKISELENQSENDCQVVGNVCDNLKNPNVIAPGMFKLDTHSEFACNNAMNAFCNSYDVDVNDFFVFDDVSIRKSQVSKMSIRKKPSASLNMPSRNNSRKSLSRNVLKWLPKLQSLAEPVAKWILRVKRQIDKISRITNSHGTYFQMGTQSLLIVFGVLFIADFPDLSLDHRFRMLKAYDGVGQLCDKGLEVAFRKSSCFVRNSSCFVRNEHGVDFITGDRSSNLYTISLNEIASNSSYCVLAKDSSLQSWFWHQRLSHLNFATINNLVENNLVRGLPKMKFEKDHLCFTCEQRKIHQKHHKSKMAFASNQPLYLLYMDLCGPMRVESINGKRYVLFVVNDFFTAHMERHNKMVSWKGEIEPKLKLKLKAKWDIGVFVGYAKDSAAFKNNEREVFHEVSKSFQGESSSSSLNDDVQQSLEEVILPQTNTHSISNDMIPNVDEASSSYNVFNERLEDAYFDASTTFHDTFDIHTYYQPYPHETKWTKYHPLHKIISDPKSIVRTKGQLSNSCLFACLLSSIEPTNAAEALKDADWVIAMQDELDQFARLKTSFLNGILKEEVYVGQPLGFVSKQYLDHVYALDKALYGLKKVPRAWYDVLSKFLIDSGFQKGSIDTTLFIKKKGEHIMLIQIYVNDIIFGSTNPKCCTNFSKLMEKHFEMSMMGEIKCFLGLQVNQFSNEIFINQSKYILDILKRFRMENCDTVPISMVEQAKLKLNLVRKPVDHTIYRSMIGSLMYLTLSHPDIMFATCMCARYQANPNEHHVSAIKRIFRYLKGTINLGLWYPKDSGFDLTVYSDAGHAGCHLDRKSTSGSFQFLGDKLVCWSSKKQNYVSISTAESEYVAVSGCCAQVLWMRTQLTNYGFFYDKVPVYCNSKSAIAISCNPVQHTRTKHIDVRYHFIKC
nr:uncharacterized mitochondrial protein AtMg00810-like [Tanacetum cinerariifolium]